MTVHGRPLEFAAAVSGTPTVHGRWQRDPDASQPADSGADQLTASPDDGSNGGGASGDLGKKLSKDDVQDSSKANTGLDDTKSQPIRWEALRSVSGRRNSLRLRPVMFLTFSTKAPGSVGGAGRREYTSVKTDPPKLETDDNGKVIDVTLTANMKTRWAVAKGTWDTNNTMAMKAVEAANKQHEQNHQRDFRRVLNQRGGRGLQQGCYRISKDARRG
jgi:hypothetical protein